ncbi:MAG: cyclase family protein [Acidimicrobiales bacterium]
MPDVTTVRELCDRFSNWGRWGDDDQLGTLNHITPDCLIAAAQLVEKGKVISLAAPFGDDGPQAGGGALGRFNPIHLMTRDGNDAAMGTTPRDFFGGRDGHFRSADDIVIMPLQCSTQWDGLAHVIFDDTMWNGKEASLVSSKGALVNAISQLRAQVSGRGVLLDVARHNGVEWLQPGHAIGADELAACADAQGVEVRRGDIVLVRTGQMAQVAAEGGWGSFAGGDAPGLGLDSASFFAEREVAALATDTWGMEVRPNETPDVFQPVHLVLIQAMGMTVGEIFDLEEAGADCADDGVYEFFFCAPPIPFERAVASPINPQIFK